MTQLMITGVTFMLRLFFGLAVVVLPSPTASVFAQGNVAIAKNDQLQDVAAEGVGTTADEALKDAFRNAVRQIVGAVVDAETLVKNDELIDDKVLTYSDGFIKGYEKVPGSEKVQGGLHRIKIKAQVERRSVVAKLKAANVTMKKVDGKGLFAEAVTQLDAEKDAAALLQKQFEGFPQSCITATVVGKPVIVEKTADKATVKFNVQIEPDLKAFKSFSDKLNAILDKLAKQKGEFTATYALSPGGNLGEMSSIGDGGFGNDLATMWMPKLFHSRDKYKEGQVSIAIATNRTKTGDRIDFRYYVLDPSLETVLRTVALLEGQCKLQLLDAEGEVVATDRFVPYEGRPGGAGGFFGNLTVFDGDRFGTRGALQIGHLREKSEGNPRVCLLVISPVFGYTTHKTTLNIPRTLELSLDELKSVKDAKVEVTFDE